MTSLFTSRKFYMALLALLVIVVAAFLPGFEIDTEAGAGFLIIIVSYLLGVAVDPGPGGWKGVFQSRKFWAAVIGLLMLFLNAFNILLPFELSPEQLISICVVIGGYITGVAFERPLTMQTSLVRAALTKPKTNKPSG
jgi:uncharacterized membrane protein